MERWKSLKLLLILRFQRFCRLWKSDKLINRIFKCVKSPFVFHCFSGWFRRDIHLFIHSLSKWWIDARWNRHGRLWFASKCLTKLMSIVVPWTAGFWQIMWCENFGNVSCRVDDWSTTQSAQLFAIRPQERAKFSCTYTHSYPHSISAYKDEESLNLISQDRCQIEIGRISLTWWNAWNYPNWYWLGDFFATYPPVYPHCDP